MMQGGGPMPSKGFYAATILGLLSAMAIVVCASPQSVQPSATGQSNAAHQQESPQSGYVMKVTTRLVTLDVSAKTPLMKAA
jgi:hypothetical protein